MLHEDKRQIFIDDSEAGTKGKYEIEADKFAADWLIASGDYEKLVKELNLHDGKNEILDKITTFSKRTKIRPEIAIGRLLHENNRLYKTGLGKEIAEIRF